MFQEPVQDTILHLVVMCPKASLSCVSISHTLSFLMIIAVLRSTVKYIVESSLVGFVGLIITIKLRLCFLGRKITEAKWHFHHIISRVGTLAGLTTVEVNLGYLSEGVAVTLLHCEVTLFPFALLWGFPAGSVVKSLTDNAGDTRYMGSIPGSGKSPGVGNSNQLQYSCLKNSMDRGAWWAAVYGVAKSLTGLSHWACMHSLKGSLHVQTTMTSVSYASWSQNMYINFWNSP